MSLHNTLAALEHQQMLDRERVIVQDLHSRGICLGPKGCVVCREVEEHKMSNVFDDIGTPNNPAKPIDLDVGNIGPMGCVRQQPSVFDDLGKIPWIPKETPDLGTTLADRGKEYGDYGQMATVAQKIKEAMGPRQHLSAVQRESLDVIATKMARIVCGNPDNPDSWLDIEGYAKLSRDRLPRAPFATP